MQEVIDYQPKFDALKNMKEAVVREVRRKKALGQYMIVVEEGEVKRVDFSIFKHASDRSNHEVNQV
ncbi:MAG: hypothetical protein L3J00_07420 [Thiomicrorhabdus sp.]|nr:hypothetical protein [Thiomicrorhabdus sp.]